MPKLSIITINYNNLVGLKRTVESVVNQTWQEFEYLIIDGGSTDGSAEYIKSQSEHIDYWVSEPDKGIYNAINKGIAKAKGEYLLFLNSGDYFTNLNILEDNYIHLAEKDIIYFDINVETENSFFVKKCPEQLTFSFFFTDTLPHQSTFIKRNLFEKHGYYDEDFEIIADWKFFVLGIILNDWTYKKINVTLSNYGFGGISSRVDFSNEKALVFEKYFSKYFTDYHEFLEDRRELIDARSFLKSNRAKMLLEIEKSRIGRKLVSFFFRTYLVLFSTNKLSDIID
jgi:glycosyltransferase involved in cell wall biosynthesis